MKKIIALAFVLMGSVSSISAQSKEQKEIKKTLEKVVELTEDGDYAGILDYTYPGIFKIASKEDLAATFEEAFNSDEIKVVMNDFNIGEVGEIKSASTANYAVVPYDYILTMTYLKDETTTDIIEMTAGSFEDMFGEENIKTDLEKKTIVITNKSKMLAIKDNGTDEWKVIEMKMDQMSLLKMILPEDVFLAIK